MSIILRQLFDAQSSSYTYLLGDNKIGKALLIDPVLEQVELYITYLAQLKLTLALCVETHVHADHISGSGKLRDVTNCLTRVSKESGISCSSGYFTDGEKIILGDIVLGCLYTPGHTSDSYCFYESATNRIFTGDTLLIRGSGRTDFQNGSPSQAFHSLQKLLTFSEHTLVYPGHDYHGFAVSTIAEERDYNPRLAFTQESDFVAFMNSQHFPKPKLMDIAVPANLACGKVKVL